MALSKELLLAAIKAKANHPNILIYAVLTGLATAIERGDYDTERRTDATR